MTKQPNTNHNLFSEGFEDDEKDSSPEESQGQSETFEQAKSETFTFQQASLQSAEEETFPPAQGPIEEPPVYESNESVEQDASPFGDHPEALNQGERLDIGNNQHWDRGGKKSRKTKAVSKTA